MTHSLLCLRFRDYIRVCIRLACHPFYCTLTSSSLTLIVTHFTAQLMLSSLPASTLVCPRPRFCLRISLRARHSHTHALSDRERVHAEPTPLLLLRSIGAKTKTERLPRLGTVGRRQRSLAGPLQLQQPVDAALLVVALLDVVQRLLVVEVVARKGDCVLPFEPFQLRRFLT